MSKKRKNEQRPPVFRNTPFHALKGVTVPPAAGTQPAPRAAVPAENLDEADLFARSVRGARPLERDEDDAAGPAPVLRTDRTPQPQADSDEQDERLFRNAMSSIGAAVVRERRVDEDDLDGDASPRSSSSRLRQLKKGTIRVSQELDLHGSLRDEALRRLKQFIAGAYARGDQAVLVITGKGINSPEGPVLQGAVREWLRGPGKELVAESAPAPRDRGGSGAVVVFLRRH